MALSASPKIISSIYTSKAITVAFQKVGPISLISQAKTDWFAFFAFYFLLGVMILLFIRPVFRDLSLLQRAAHRFSKKPQRIELDIKPNSSIAPLASTFTDMSERINKFVQLHNDLSRIISHEIRTPLTPYAICFVDCRFRISRK